MKDLIPLFLMLLLTSCAAVYIPNSPNAVMLAKKGEIQASGQFGVSGVNVQSAVAITDHIAVMANCAYAVSRDFPIAVTPFGDDARHNSNNYETAVGYYRNYAKTCLEIFGGYGWGEGLAFKGDEKTTYPNGGLITAQYTRIFIQPSYGWKFKRMHLSMTYRLSRLNYSYYEKFGEVTAKKPAFVFEPGASLKVNFWQGRIFWISQAGFILNMSSNDNDPDFFPINISTGIGFRLNSLMK